MMRPANSWAKYKTYQELSVICLENDVVKATQYLVECGSVNTIHGTFFLRNDTILTRRIPRQSILSKVVPRLNDNVLKSGVSHNNIGCLHFTILQNIKGIGFHILLVQIFSLCNHAGDHEITETLQIVIE